MKINSLFISITVLLGAVTATLAQTKAITPTHAKPATSDTIPEAHLNSMEAVLGKPRKTIRTIGILVYDGVNELDVMGPRYVLGQSMRAKTQLIGLKPGPIRTVMGVTILPDNVIDSVNALDILVIPGGFKGTVEAAYDPNILDWIRKIDKTTTYTASVCTGGWILGATGLLKGKRAVTNWYREGEMLKKYGAVPAEKRYTHDGKYWTSAGVTAGMDMSLALLNDIWGERYTQAVMLDMEYDPQPPIRGGSPEKTSPAVNQMMLSMYDMGMQPLIDSLEKQKQVPATPKTVPSASKPAGTVSKTTGKTAALDTVPAGLLADGTDPVCHMVIPKGTEPTAMFGGKQYGFCSEMCHKRFIKNPAQFVKK